MPHCMQDFIWKDNRLHARKQLWKFYAALLYPCYILYQQIAFYSIKKKKKGINFILHGFKVFLKNFSNSYIQQIFQF